MSDNRASAFILGLVAVVIIGLIVWTTTYHLARYECEEAYGGRYIVWKCL